MAASLPDAHTRWRCGGCGNLTRFDVTRTRRTTEFWHFDLAGEHRVEESTTDEEDVVHGDVPLVRTLRRRRAGLPCGSGRVHAVTGAEALEPDPAVPGLDRPLPDRVRARVVALAADSLGRMPADQVPASLARVAAFAPARRARLAATQIASVLATDDGFREHVAADVRAQVPDLAGALDAGTPPSAADPVDLAAVAYLIRPDGWAGLVAASGDVSLAEDTGGRATARRPGGPNSSAARSRRSPRASRRPARRHREQVAELKAENAELRHKLGDARTRARSAEAASDDCGGGGRGRACRGGRGDVPPRRRAAAGACARGGARAGPGRRTSHRARRTRVGGAACAAAARHAARDRPGPAPGAGAAAGGGLARRLRRGARRRARHPHDLRARLAGLRRPGRCSSSC